MRIVVAIIRLLFAGLLILGLATVLPDVMDSMSTMAAFVIIVIFIPYCLYHILQAVNELRRGFIDSKLLTGYSILFSFGLLCAPFTHDQITIETVYLFVVLAVPISMMLIYDFKHLFRKPIKNFALSDVLDGAETWNDKTTAQQK
jgi:hypothetical protein